MPGYRISDLSALTSATVAADDVMLVQDSSETGAVRTKKITIDDLKTTTSADALLKASNLSDLTNTTTARTNLGLGTAAEQNTGTSGATVPLLNGNNTHSGINTFSAAVSCNAGITSRVDGSQTNFAIRRAATSGATQLAFQLNDSGGNNTDYSRIVTSIVDATDTSEDGQLFLQVAVAGTLISQLTLTGSSATFANPALVPAGSAAAPSLAGSGDSDTGIRFPGSNVGYLVAGGSDEIQWTTTALSPVTNDGNALGTTALNWSDLFLASGAVINFNNGDVLITHSSDLLNITGGRLACTQNASATTPSMHAINSTDNASVMALRIEGDRATPAANDIVYASFFLSDDAGNQDEFIRIFARATSVASGAESGQLRISLMQGGALVEELILSSTNLLPTTNDGLALGSTALSWADLFLASGGVLNWNNGDVTITHATNQLNFAGADNGFRFGNAVVPATDDGAALGTTALKWSDLFLASGGVLNWNNGDVTVTHSSNALSGAGGSLNWQYDGTSQTIANFSSNLGTVGVRGISIISPATDSGSDPFLINTGNSIAIQTDAVTRLLVTDNGVDVTGRITSTYSTGSYVPTFINTVDASGNVVLSLQSDRATPAANDSAIVDFRLSDSAGNQDLFGRITILANTVTSTAENGNMTFGLMKAGTHTTLMILSAAGSTLAPNANDGLALGTTALNWSDLFLASGAVINFNNGDVLITHSSDLLNITGGRLACTQNASATTPSMQAINSTDNASVMALRIEGDRATPAASDQVYMSFFLSDSAGNQNEFARISCVGTNVTDGAETGQIRFATLSSGTVSNRLVISSVGVFPVTDDGLALGLATNKWSDLFLASGAVINFNNGNSTITHAADKLTVVGEVILDDTKLTSTLAAGFRGAPVNTQNTDYTFVLSDAGKTIYHDEATARTYTIPANGSVAYPIGTTIIIDNTGNAGAAGTVTLQITTDTLRRGDGTAGTGSRTIAASAVAVVRKTKSTEWVITGTFT